MFPSETAVSNCAFVPVIPTIEVWSPVLLPEEEPEKLVAVKLPESSIVAQEFCKSFPVVRSYRAIALSVEEAGQTTSPVPVVMLPLPRREVEFIVLMFVPDTSVSCLEVARPEY